MNAGRPSAPPPALWSCTSGIVKRRDRLACTRALSDLLGPNLGQTLHDSIHYSGVCHKKLGARMGIACSNICLPEILYHVQWVKLPKTLSAGTKLVLSP